MINKYRTWNVRGKDLKVLEEFFHSTQEDAEVIFLQEVGGLGSITSEPVPGCGPLHELVPEDPGDLYGYRLFGSCCLLSHLGQVILVCSSIIDHVLDSYCGEWAVGLQIQHT